MADRRWGTARRRSTGPPPWPIGTSRRPPRCPRVRCTSTRTR
jgi:hypothetical protein